MEAMMEKSTLPIGAKALLTLAVLVTLLGLFSKATIWVILWGCVSYYIYKREYSKVAKAFKILLALQVSATALILGFILLGILSDTDKINPNTGPLTSVAMVIGLLIPLSILYFWYFRKLTLTEVQSKPLVSERIEPKL